MPVFFLIAVIFTLLIRYEAKKGDSQSKKTSEAFWKAESEASFTRKQDISGLPYIQFPAELVESLPTLSDPRYNSLLADLNALAGQPILRLSGITNTELRATYGSGNFAFLAECDERYDKLYMSLKEAGEILKGAGYEKEYEAITSLLSDLETSPAHT